MHGRIATFVRYINMYVSSSDSMTASQSLTGIHAPRNEEWKIFEDLLINAAGLKRDSDAAARVGSEAR